MVVDRMKGAKMLDEKLLKRAVDMINEAYDAFFVDDELFDQYEDRIEYYAKKLGVSYNWLEDCATLTREYGWDRD